MEFLWRIFDGLGSPITGGGAFTEIKMYRVADGFLLDWADTTFKASGWTTLAPAMDEVDAVNIPGLYKKAVTEAGFNDGRYIVFTRYTGTDKQAGEYEFLIKDGKVIEEKISDKLPANYIMGSSVLSAKDDEIDAIKTQTDKLLFDTDSYVKSVQQRPEGVVVAHEDNDTGTFRTNLTQPTDHWNGAGIKFTSGVLAGQVRKILAYNNTNGVIHTSSGFTAVPAGGDKFVIINE